MATVGRGAEQYTVRFPDGLRDRIKRAADKNNRSMNAEIVATLEEKYPNPSPLDRGLVDFLKHYVDKGETLSDRKARSREANNILKTFEETKSFSIRALDDLGSNVHGERVILGTSAASLK